MRGFWWGARETATKPRVVENIGPDKKRILLRLRVTRHAATENPETIDVSITLRGGLFTITVPREAADRMPVGQVAIFELVQA